MYDCWHGVDNGITRWWGDLQCAGEANIGLSLVQADNRKTNPKLNKCEWIPLRADRAHISVEVGKKQAAKCHKSECAEQEATTQADRQIFQEIQARGTWQKNNLTELQCHAQPHVSADQGLRWLTGSRAVPLPSKFCLLADSSLWALVVLVSGSTWVGWGVSAVGPTLSAQVWFSDLPQSWELEDSSPSFHSQGPPPPSPLVPFQMHPTPDSHHSLTLRAFFQNESVAGIVGAKGSWQRADPASSCWAFFFFK